MVTPTKRTKAQSVSPLKRRSSRAYARAHVSEDESDSELVGKAEKEIDDPEKIFHCKFAIDSRRGIFYTFEWERHRRDALSKGTPPSIKADPSCQKSLPQWGEGCHWDVEEKKDKFLTRRSKKSRLENNVPESDGVSSDEYQNHDTTDLDETEEGEASESDKDAREEIDDVFNPRTPSKKRKRDKTSTSTPRKRKRTGALVEITPYSKVALAKRSKHTVSSSKRKSLVTFPVRYPAQSLDFQASMVHIPRNPWLRSMHALHVGSRPNALPCREEEYARVLKCVGELLEEGSGGCICELVCFVFCYGLQQRTRSDISGVPGTGKTATVHTVIRELKRMAQNNVCRLTCV